MVFEDKINMKSKESYSEALKKIGKVTMNSLKSKNLNMLS